MNQLKKLEAMIAAFNIYFYKHFAFSGKIKESFNHYYVNIEDNIAQDLKYFDREIDVLIKDIANYKIKEISQSLNIFKNYKQRILNYLKIGQKQNPNSIEFEELKQFANSLNELIDVCEEYIKED